MIRHRSGAQVAAAAVLLIAAGLLFAVRLRSPGQPTLRPPPVPLPLRIAAASDLRFALDELTAGYRQTRPMVSARVTYGSSGTLYAQILNGAGDFKSIWENA